jgi:MFS transporter, DHA2 family, multidrug resistance protein
LARSPGHSALHAGASQKLWIINAYPLVMAGLLPGAGTLGDRIGHKRMFLAGLALFAAASLLAAFAPSPPALIAARAFLAVGAAAMLPATAALIRITFDDEHPAHAMTLSLLTVIAIGALSCLTIPLLPRHAQPARPH